jgi:hypothetical protein
MAAPLFCNNGQEFKRMFAAQFLASWVATNYNDYCARGLQDHLETPPVEDAVFLADKAWDHYVATNHPNWKQTT